MDIIQLGQIIGLATSAVGLTDKATSTVASIKELFEGDNTPDNTEAAKLLNALAGDLNICKYDECSIEYYAQDTHR